jgi:hypothetical protein
MIGIPGRKQASMRKIQGTTGASIFRLALAAASVVLAASCRLSTNAVGQPSATADLSTPSGPSAATQESTASTEPIDTLRPSPSPDQRDSIFQPVGFQVEFEGTLEDLSSGLYFLEDMPDSATRTERLRYLNASTGQRGLLVATEELVFFQTASVEERSSLVIAGSPHLATRFVIDLTAREAYEFEACHDGRPVMPSPQGHWLVTMCSQVGEDHGGTVQVQVVSLVSGEEIELNLAANATKRFGSDFVYWVTEDSFVAHLGPDEEPCLISLPGGEMRCAPSLAGKEISSPAPGGNWLLVYRRDRIDAEFWNAQDVYSFECFKPQAMCEPLAVFDDEFASDTSMRWSPDATRLAVDSGHPLSSPTAKFGYFDTDSWAFHELAVLPRASHLFGWCPDSSCLIILGEPSYLAYLDGRLEQLPVVPLSPIAVVEVP